MEDMESGDIERMRKLERMKALVKSRVLTKSAIERLGRLKMVKPEVAEQLELFIVQLYQQGQLKSMIDDAQLKEILEGISSKKDFNIIKR